MQILSKPHAEAYEAGAQAHDASLEADEACRLAMSLYASDLVAWFMKGYADASQGVQS